MKINNIDFDIINIDVEQKYITQNFGYSQLKVPAEKSIRITAKTSNSNYMSIDNWHCLTFSSNSASLYKKGLNYNGLIIEGIFIIDYTFDAYHINVTFSGDYMSGDIKMIKLRELRKAKLDKLKEICQQRKLASV